MRETLLVGLIVLQSITLVALVAVAVLYIRKTNDATREIGQAAKEVRDCLIPVAQDLRRAINDTDGLVLAAKAEVESIGRVTTSIERIIDAAHVFQAAEKAVTSSRTTVVSLIQGIKAGLNALRITKDNSEEESKHGE